MFYFLFDAINISLIVTALLNFLLGVLIFISGRNKKINIVYSLNIVAIISWIMAMFFYRSSSPEYNMLWCTILYVTPTLIASSFLYFTYIFPSQKEKYIWRRALLIFGINLAIIVMVIWPGLIIREVNVRPGLEKQIIFTPYYWFYFIYTLEFFSFGFFRLFKKYLKTRGIERLQIIYLVTGYSLAANLAFGTNLIMPWIGYFFLNWLGQVFTCIMVAFTTYAILRYRLMDIRVMFRKAIIYFVSAAFAYGTFYLITWFYNKFFGGVYTNGAYVLGLIVAPSFVLLFVWVNEKVKRIANKYLFFSLYSSQETVAKLTDELTNSIDLNKIVDLIVNSIKEAMQLDRAGILLIDQKEGMIKYKIAKVIGFNENNGISLVQDNFLTQHLEKTQKPLVRDELQMISKDLGNIEEKQGFNQLAENMKHIEAPLCLPMIISNKLIGIIVLGSKVSGDAYTSDDLNLLSTLSKQAAIAVDNARLYKEVQDFSQTLKQKVDEQTKEIKEQKDEVEKAFELEKHANEELKHLDENKTDFMLITQHHLRTPLSVNAGFIDLMLNGTFGRMSAKIKDVVLRLRESTQKEIDVVNELLDVSGYQIGKEVIHFQPIDFEALMEETLKDLTVEAEVKGIYLKYEKRGEIPSVPADRMKMKLVITNVIDNCIKYTMRGGVTVNMEVKNDKFLISVTDTGIGMSDEARQNLFKHSFNRGEQAKKIFAVGKGLGLYLSGKVIEGHHGRIWAESLGDGKGSAFYIELPLEQELNKQLKVENNVSASVNNK